MQLIIITAQDVSVQMMIEEQSVVAAKIDRGGYRQHASFRIPLRTKLELHFYGRWKRSPDPPSSSRWDCLGEEVSKSVFHAVTGAHIAFRGVYLYLLMATNAPLVFFFWGGGGQLKV